MSLTFRPLQWIDALPLYVWRTDPETVKWSLNPPPTWEEHLGWMNKSLSAPPIHWMGIHDMGNSTVMVSADQGVINIMTNPELRCFGYGYEAILFMQAQWIFLTARIMFGNTASLKLFTKCGFQIEDMDDKCIIMEWRKA